MIHHEKLIIGVPVYNEEKYLHQCLSSIQDQSHQDFICIISDNCSTDASVQIASDFTQKDNRFFIVKQNKNIGSSKNFEYLLKETDSLYFMWVGAHDLLDANALSKYLQEYEKENISCVFSNFSIVNEIGELKRIDHSGMKWDVRFRSKILRFIKSSLVRGGCPPINGLFRRKSLLKIGDVPIFSGPDRYIMPIVAYDGNLICKEESLYFHREVQARSENYIARITGKIKNGFIQQSKIPLAWNLVKTYALRIKSLSSAVFFPIFILLVFIRHVFLPLIFKIKN